MKRSPGPNVEETLQPVREKWENEELAELASAAQATRELVASCGSEAAAHRACQTDGRT